MENDKDNILRSVEKYRVDDSLFAEAYEGTNPEIRALLKTAIAFYFRLFGNSCDSKLQKIRSQYTGFQFTVNTNSVPWVLAVIDGNSVSPALFLAQICPAILAGVSHIIIVSQEKISSLLLTAMELAGLEECFVLPQQQIITLYKKLSCSGKGRVIFFQSEKMSKQADVTTKLMKKAPADNIPFLLTHQKLNLICQDNIQEKMKIFKLLYPEAEIYPELPTQDITADALFTEQEISTDSSYPLILGPGMEACFPLTPPEFYHINTYTARLYSEKNDE